MKKIYDNTLGRLTLKAADIIISTSQHDAEVIKQFKISSEKLEIIPNAVNIEDFTIEKEKNDDGTLNILYIGDLEPWKGVQYLIEAVKK
ncbi:MAG: glycosyltransferase [Candidatus Lokiarchaeia archaeon]